MGCRRTQPSSTASGTTPHRQWSSTYFGVTTEAALRAKFEEGTRFQFSLPKQARDAGCIIDRVADDDGDKSHRELCPASNPSKTLRGEADRLKNAAARVPGDEPPIAPGSCQCRERAATRLHHDVDFHLSRPAGSLHSPPSYAAESSPPSFPRR